MFNEIDNLVAPEDRKKAIEVLRESGLIFEEQKLKDCPFCGGEAERSKSNLRADAHFVTCKKCQVITREYGHKAQAQKAWNSRKDSK